MNDGDTFERLIIAADDAYRRARTEVYDLLSVGEPADPEKLSDRQRQLLLDLRAAEAAVAAYREDQYAMA
jgi:hypothetical protein